MLDHIITYQQAVTRKEQYEKVLISLFEANNNIEKICKQYLTSEELEYVDYSTISSCSQSIKSLIATVEKTPVLRLTLGFFPALATLEKVVKYLTPIAHSKVFLDIEVNQTFGLSVEICWNGKALVINNSILNTISNE